MAHGKHRKEKDNKGAAIITTGALSLGAFAMASGSANAATEEEWDRVAKCESNGQWDLPGGDRDSTGGIQFRVASWNDALSYLRSKGVDTSGYPALAYQATREQQIIAGEALLALQGPRAWSVTWNGGAHCGNAAAGALSSGSMFEGGPHPFGESDPPAPKEPAPEPSAPKPEPAKPKPAEGKDAETHTVVPGDTLYGITKAHTGDASHDNWKPLYEANRDVVGDNPHLIYPGQVLKLTGKAKPEAPAKPEPKPEAPAPKALFAPPLDAQFMGNLGDGMFAGPGGSYSRGQGGHSGADWAAPSGANVYSVASGKVIIGGAGASGYGNHVVIDHGDGTYTLYAHLRSINVTGGASVSAGDKIGEVGSTGNSSGPHLHFEVRTHPSLFSGFIDPVSWLKGKGLL